MKKHVAFTLLISILISCSEEKEVSESAARQAAISRMEENAIVTNEAFALTTEKFNTMDKPSLNMLISTYSRDAFIKYMLSQTAGIFNNAINKLRTERGWAQPESYTGRTQLADSYIFKSYLDGIAKGIDGTSPGKGVIDNFSNFVEQEIERRSGGNGGQIHIESFSWSANQSGGFRSSPIKFDDILFVKESVENLIILHQDENQLDAALNLFAEQNPDQGVLVSLLVPAVQMARDLPRASHINNIKQMHLAFFGDSPVLGLTQPQWTQKLRQAMFLAAVYAILDDNFNPTDQDYASITPQRTMYEALLVLTSVAYYDRPK
jgi:hypothetical protein